MTVPTSHDSASTTPTTTISDILDEYYPEYEPVVRYAHPDSEDGHPAQKLTLHHIHDPVPDDAKWVSAIYLISEGQSERFDEHSDEPYANPSSDNIVKSIQDECEKTGRVLYSVHAESDAHEDEEEDSELIPLRTMIEWLQNFVQTVVNIDPDACSFYYSGNRSIHVHCPLFVTGENLRWLKDQTKQFCNETGAELDANIYKPKPQFRLTGAIHGDIGLKKTPIHREWNHSEIISAAATDVERPRTYAEMANNIYRLQDSTDLSDLLLASTSTVSQQQSQSEPDSVLSKWPSRYIGHKKRRAYEAKEFYPYPTGQDHDGRSVASIRIVDEQFQRTAAGRKRTYIPCYFYGAHSCSGREFTKDQHYAPLQLSKSDAKKWDYAEGEMLVVIGGGNYQSIIHKIDKETAEHLGDLLDPDNGDRDDALDYLREEGYDVGSSGPSQPTRSTTNQQPAEKQQDSISPDEKTDALRYKERAEQGSVEMSLGHDERRKVANRLLTLYGWDHAWQWFREQYGEEFDPQRTWQEFRSIIRTHSDDEDLAQIDVPSRP